MPSWTDASNLHKKGVPTVVFGAGKLEVAHTPWESVSIRELEKLSAVLKALVDSPPARRTV
jgi:acetylornithine deacetylase/succinyl-diaminopimelate desuccinylase